jgi:acyl transferase domain-containing protein
LTATWARRHLRQVLQDRRAQRHRHAPFGDGADGFVMGEGAGAFLLKRLSDAERDGDKIYAVIRGVGGSSDGKGKGITAPNPVGQIWPCGAPGKMPG